MRARTFWIALPLAIVLALCLGPGLARDDVSPHVDPAVDAQEPRLDVPSPAELGEPESTTSECEPAHDPGPDGDR